MTDRWQQVVRRPSRVRTRWNPTRYAVREVVRFERRYGTPHLQLACHAALPLIVTPELVNLVRLNFLDRADVPWMADVDFLLAPLCRELETDEGVYEVEPAIREVLLAELEQQFDWSRLQQVARFLHAYVQGTPAWRRRRDYCLVHRWIARAYLEPQGTAEDLQRALEQSVTGILQPWEALARQTELATLVEHVSEPLVRAMPSDAFSRLAGAARLVADRIYEAEPDWTSRHEGGLGPTLDPAPLAEASASAVRLWWQHSGEVAPDTSERAAELAVGDEVAPGVRLQQRLASSDQAIVALDCSPDGEWLAMATNDHRVQLWAQGETTVRFHLDINARQLTWHPSGRHLAVVNDTGSLVVFEVPKAWAQYQLLHGCSPAVQPSWSPDGELLATADENRVYLWQHRTEGKLLNELETKQQVTALSWPAGRSNLALGHPNSVTLWNSRGWSLLTEMDAEWVRGLFWSTESRQLLGWFSGGVQVWDIDTGQSRIAIKLEGIVACALSQDSRWLAVQSRQSHSQPGEVQLWSTRDWNLVATIPGQSPSTRGRLIDFIGSEQLVTLDAEGRVSLWSLDAQRFPTVAPEPRLQQTKVLVMGPTGAGKTSLIVALARGGGPSTEVPWRPDREVPVGVITSLAVESPSGFERELALVELHQASANPWTASFRAEGADGVIFVTYLGADRGQQMRQWDRWFTGQFRGDDVPLKGLVVNRQDVQFQGLEPLFRFADEMQFDLRAACSALTGEGIDELRGMLASSLPWSRLPALSRSQRQTVIDQLDSAASSGAESISLAGLAGQVNQVTREVISDEELLAALQRLPAQCVVLPRQDLVLLKPRLLDMYLDAVHDRARSQPDGLPYVAYDWAVDGRLESEPAADEPILTTERLRTWQAMGTPPGHGTTPERQRIWQAVLRELEIRGSALRLTDETRSWLIFPELWNEPTDDRSDHPGEPAFRFFGSPRAVLLTILVYFATRGRYRIDHRYRNSAEIWDNEGPNMFVVSIATVATGSPDQHELHLVIDATPEMTDVIRREVEHCLQQVVPPESVESLEQQRTFAVPGMPIYNRNRQPTGTERPVTCTLGGFVRLKDGRVALLTVGSRLTGEVGDQIAAAGDGRGETLAVLHRSTLPVVTGSWTRIDAAVAVLEPHVRPRATRLPDRSPGMDWRTALLQGRAPAEPQLGDEVLAPGSNDMSSGFVDALHVRITLQGTHGPYRLHDVFSVRRRDRQPFASPDDAGALVVRPDGAVLGMIVATSDTAALACPILTILDEFQCELITELPSDE